MEMHSLKHFSDINPSFDWFPIKLLCIQAFETESSNEHDY